MRPDNPQDSAEVITLLREYTGDRVVGSNPTPSASFHDLTM